MTATVIKSYCVLGVGNVEDIQDELNGMLFGASNKKEEAATTSSEVVEVKPKEPFVPRFVIVYLGLYLLVNCLPWLMCWWLSTVNYHYLKHNNTASI